MPKVYALEGDWLGEPYQRNILPILEKANIPRIKERLIPLYEDQSAPTSTDIAVLDYHTWYYSDQIFYEYIRKVAFHKYPAVCIFENPFGWERPLNIDLYRFGKKLQQRTEIACKLLRSQSPQTKIISPAIRVLREDIQKEFIKYFVHNRSLFDAYAVHCCTEISDHSLGALSSFLYQVLKILPKPVWVTRWSVPSCDSKIKHPSSMQATEWTQISSIEASVKLKTMYKVISELSPADVSWFFAGVCQDIYSPYCEPPDIWSANRSYLSNEYSKIWLPEHFIGTLTYDEKIKHPVINSFLELAGVQE